LAWDADKLMSLSRFKESFKRKLVQELSARCETETI
jgi:hypothetical protein